MSIQPLSYFRRASWLAILALAAMLLLAACDDEGNGDGGDATDATETATEAPADGGDTATPTETATEAATEEGDDQAQAGGTIQVGYVPGWAEGVASTYLWAHILEERGYTVELTSLEIASLFAGLAEGDIDFYTDAWLPKTHDVYMEEFGDQIVELQTWYEPAGLYLTVPSYVDVNSLAALPENSELFDSRIVGIEPGAGMMGILREDVMPAYGLEDWELVESSTSAMLAELESAIEAQEPIVVTLWSPGWWYAEYDLTNLEDPENAWGDPDHISVVTRTGFEEDFPEVASMLQNFTMNDEQLSSLENLIREMGEGNEAAAVDQWVSEHQDLIDEWTGS